MHAVAIFVGSVIDDIEFAICKKKKKTCRGSSFTCIRSKCTNNASASVARATSIWNYANCNWGKKLNKAFIETCLISRRIIRRITNRQMWEQFEENWDK